MGLGIGAAALKVAETLAANVLGAHDDGSPSVQRSPRVVATQGHHRDGQAVRQLHARR